MNFGRLHVARLWRLSKAGATCEGLVVDADRQLRLVVVEGGRIVHWEKFATAALLRHGAATILQHRRKTGWTWTVVAGATGGVESRIRRARAPCAMLVPPGSDLDC
jgi:hypothetical protein